MVTITPLFDPSDPKMQSRVFMFSYVDPIRRVRIDNGSRSHVVWVDAMPGGSAGWFMEFNVVDGPGPLLADEREALEEWFDAFATKTWPSRTMIWNPRPINTSPLYRYRVESGTR